MESKQDRNRRLADYIYDDLSSEDVLEMEKDLASDPDLSASYELHMQVKDYLQTKLQLEEMRSDPMLEEAEKLADMAFEVESPEEVPHLSVPVRPSRKRIRNITFAVAVAAGVTIIFALGILPAGIDQDRLFDRYYSPYEASDYMQRGQVNESYRDMAAGINQYVEGNYRESISQFSRLSSDPAIHAEAEFYSALSYMGLGQYQSAENILETILDGNYRNQAEIMWYLSLCYLKTREFDRAGALLGQLESYDGLYKKDAQALRKKLARLSP